MVMAIFSHAHAQVAEQPGPALEEAIQRLKMPGVTINLKERSVDIAAEICLDKGMLELIACTKGSKEHESIVAIEARPMHIHTALLLLGAKSGNPAMLDLPPKGSAVEVLLVFPDKAGKPAEHPISEFIMRAAEEKEADRKFPTNTFLFAGSRLVEDGAGPRKYVGDHSGNVISVVSFGDEVLCLPDIHSDQTDSLLWQVNAAGLPAVGTKVTLRLRPQIRPNPL